MNLSDLSCNLRESSFNIVIVRGRQYLRENGTYRETTRIPTGTVSQVGKLYKVATEIQAIACHSNTYDGKKTGFIKLSFDDPSPSYHPDCPPQSKLRSIVWTGEEPVETAWIDTLHNSWIDIPIWLSPRQAVFCQQCHPDSDYTIVSDVPFLRQLDAMIFEIKQHQTYHHRRMKSVAKNTPLNERGREYSMQLHEHNTRNLLLETILYRLTWFTAGRFNELTKNLGIPQIKPIKIPFA